MALEVYWKEINYVAIRTGHIANISEVIRNATSNTSIVLSLNLKQKEVEEEIKHHKARDYGVPWLTATEYC